MAFPYTSEFISLELVRLAAAKAPLIDKVWQLLLHKLLNLLDRLFKTGFGRTCDMKVERRILRNVIRE